MYIKRILLLIVLLGVIASGVFAYFVYNTMLKSNTTFTTPTAEIFIPTAANFNEVKTILKPYLKNLETFETLARHKKYISNIKAGRYLLKSGMNNNDIINTIRSQNQPIQLQFNNQDNLSKLAGRIATQVEPDSTSLIQVFTEPEFLKANNFTKETALAMYIPNQYELFWNISAIEFKERMLKEYNSFWTNDRLEKAKALKLSPQEVSILASIVQKETAKVDERPAVAGVYINRLKRGMLLQADPTVIYALKKKKNDFNWAIKRVLYKDLEIDSPYNTYKYVGLPPGLIAMPDISSIDAVLNYEKHNYYYFVADVERIGYHKFAKTLTQHNRNRQAYIRWINSKNINR